MLAAAVVIIGPFLATYETLKCSAVKVELRGSQHTDLWTIWLSPRLKDIYKWVSLLVPSSKGRVQGGGVCL